MKFLRIELTNFRQFAEAQLDLDCGGVWLVCGENEDSASADSNMSGKTTLLEAVYYALFGETLRGDPVGEVVRWPSCGGDGTMQVRLTVEVNGTPYQVVRGRERQVSSCQLFDLASGVQLAKGKEATALLEKLLGVDASTFRRTSFLCRNMEDRLTRLRDSEVKALLESITGMDIFSTAREIASRRYAEATRAQQEAAAKMAKLEGALDNERNVQASLEASLEEATGQATREETLSREARRLEQDMLDLEANEVAHSTRLDQLDTAATQLTGKLTKARQQLSKLERESATYTADLNSLVRQRDERDNLISIGACPTCGADTDRPDLRAALEEYDLLILERSGIVEQLDEKVEKQRAEISKWAAEHTTLVQESAAERSSQRNAATTLSTIRRKLAAVNEELHVIHGQLASLEQQVAASQERMATLQAEYQLAAPAHAAAIRQAETLRFWAQQGFGSHGLRAALMPMILESLNGALVRYSQAITRGDMLLTLRAKRKLVSGEEVDELGFEVSGAADRYESWSSGQQRRGDVAIHLALSELASAYSGFSSSILVLDEVDQGLDQLGMEGLLDALQERARQGITVFLVTHNPNLASLVDQKIVVTRQDRKSWISLSC